MTVDGLSHCHRPCRKCPGTVKIGVPAAGSRPWLCARGPRRYPHNLLRRTDSSGLFSFEMMQLTVAGWAERGGQDSPGATRAAEVGTIAATASGWLT
jgi:hypothetical protein